jgi:hypothetical protein
MANDERGSMTRAEIDATILRAAANILREHSHYFNARQDDAGVNDLLAALADEAADEVEYYLGKLGEYAGMLERLS